jgi:hypothetical protein
MPASTLWGQLQAMPRPHRLIDFPRTGPDGQPVGKIAMFVLTQEEQMICAAAAEKFAKEKLKDSKKDDIGYETLYANASVVEILYRACKDSENIDRPAFPSPNAMRQLLTTDECSRLFEFYLGVQLELGPIVASLSDEELDAWIERIAQGGLAASPFILLSSETQRLLAYFMAKEIISFRSGKSSAGSPPDEQQSAVEPEPTQTYELA